MAVYNTVSGAVKGAFQSALSDAFPALKDLAPFVSAANPKFGDYQCNNAMGLFKTHKAEVGGLTSPKAIAEKISEHLPKEMFSKISVAPQGFITVTLKNDVLTDFLVREFNGELNCKAEKPLNCLVDYSSPNIAKEMHVGHLRSTIIGESLCRVFEFVGHSVRRINHLGDWGTQFGMLIEFMREKYPNFQNDPPELTDLTRFYKEAKIRFDADEVFKKKAQLAVPELQGGGAEARAAWKIFCDISRADFQKIYDRLGVNLIERGESYYNDMIGPIIEDLERDGFLTLSDGAKCFFSETDPVKRENEVPLMIQKSDGGFGYDSTDLAALKHRLVIEKNDWVVVITDLGQELHFTALYRAGKKLGWYDPPRNRADHIGFGLVLGEDGKKFKTRSGHTVKLVDLLDEAVERALVEIKQRRSEEVTPSQETDAKMGEANSAQQDDGAAVTTTTTAATTEDCGVMAESGLSERKAAEAIGYAAVKYFDLKQNRTTNYKFSYDKMLDPKGNTAVYLLYAYARICAIFRKAGIDPKTLNCSNLVVTAPQEKDLALQMLKLYEIIGLVLEDLHLHRIAEYLYELCGVFTSFYSTCKVVGDPAQESRLILCELTRRFMAKAFFLLGIQPLTRI